MNTAQGNISGFFTINSQTRGTRIAWIVGIPIGLAVLAVGVYLTMDAFQNRSSGHGPDGMTILLFIMFFFVLPVLLVLAGLNKMFQKPGVYFTGIKTTDSGFEAGTLTVDVASVEPKGIWRKTCSGRILTGNWKHEKTIASDF